MDCSHFKNNIFAFTEGTLSEASHLSLERHVASCASCKQLLTEFDILAEIIESEKLTGTNPFAATRILQHLENELGRPKNRVSPVWLRILQPVAITLALLSGLFIGTYTSKEENPRVKKPANSSENIEFLRSNLFISEFADEDKILVLNK